MRLVYKPPSTRRLFLFPEFVTNSDSVGRMSVTIRYNSRFGYELKKQVWPGLKAVRGALSD